MLEILIGMAVVAVLALAWAIRYQDARHREARNRNPRPLPYLDEPWGDR